MRILAGDFNATLDHRELRRLVGTGYEDAAAEAGAGLRGTWPDRGPFLPVFTIHHVLADARCGVVGGPGAARRRHGPPRRAGRDHPPRGLSLRGEVRDPPVAATAP